MRPRTNAHSTTQLSIASQLAHSLGHTVNIALVHQKTGDALDDHIWYSRMTRRYDWECCGPGFEDRDGSAFGVAIGRGNGMLNEAAGVGEEWCRVGMENRTGK